MRISEADFDAILQDLINGDNNLIEGLARAAIRHAHDHVIEVINGGDNSYDVSDLEGSVRDMAVHVIQGELNLEDSVELCIREMSFDVDAKITVESDLSF